MDELVELQKTGVLYDASVTGFAVFFFGMVAVLAQTVREKQTPERTFLKGLGWAAAIAVVLFFLSLFLNEKVFDPVMRLALSQDRVTVLYRSGAEVAFERGQVQSVREYTSSYKSSTHHNRAITPISGPEVTFRIPSRKERELAEAIASRLGLHPSVTDGLWTAKEL